MRGSHLTNKPFFIVPARDRRGVEEKIAELEATQAYCQDEVDAEIIERLIRADEGGALLSVIAKALSAYGLKLGLDVTRRIQRMNKKLVKELVKPVAEKRGRR